MRNVLSCITLALAAGMLMTSCHKSHHANHTTQVVNATIDMNKSYQLDLGVVSEKEGANITEQAQHYSVSETSAINSENHVTYNYTPAMNYTGSDEASVTVAVGHQCLQNGNCGGCDHPQCHHDHHCGHDCDHNTTTYIIKINVNRAPASTSNTAVINAGNN